MSNEHLEQTDMVTRLEAIMPPVVRHVGGRVIKFCDADKTLTMHFQARPEFCHSEIIVQGGILTTMLDATMAYTVVALTGVQQQVATLELKMNFVSPGHPGDFSSLGRVVHMGKSTVFMEGELHQEGRLVATASATGKLVTPRAW